MQIGQQVKIRIKVEIILALLRLLQDEADETRDLHEPIVARVSKRYSHEFNNSPH